MIYEAAYMKALLRKYLQGRATPLEKARLMAAWEIYDDEELSDMIAEINGELRESDIEYPDEALPKNAGSTQWTTWGLVTLVSILLAGVLYLLFLKEAGPVKQALYCENGMPGELPTSGYSCNLFLSDGRKLFIDSSSKGLIARQGSVAILQLQPGLLEYRFADSTKKTDSTRLYNAIVTAPGQQYRLQMADGSLIRLNAGSAMKFPVSFPDSGGIGLKGEASFEISDNRKSVYVISSNAELQLQAGRYNIKANLVDVTFATVVTGVLDLKSSNHRALVQAGKQARLFCERKHNHELLELKKTDTAAALSWNKPVRHYSGIPLWEFVTDMGKWYNLEVAGLDHLPENRRISIAICYNTPMENMLQVLREQGLHFVQEGKRIRFYERAPETRN